MKMIPISFNPKQAFVYYFVQWLVITFLITLGFNLYNKFPFALWEIKLMLILPTVMAILFLIITYLGPFKKISVLYKDSQNNLYVDKILVDKNLILSIKLETMFYFNKIAEYYIMTFSELPTEIKKKNFNKNVVVFSDAKIISKWPNLKNNTEKYLSDIGVKQEIIYTMLNG